MNPMNFEQATVVGGELAIRFACGVEMYLPLPYLRANCPCAECHQKRSALGYAGIVGKDSQARHLSAVEAVGGYAVRLVWSDGHGSGIYSFDLLRQLSESSGNNAGL